MTFNWMLNLHRATVLQSYIDKTVDHEVYICDNKENILTIKQSNFQRIRSPCLCQSDQGCVSQCCLHEELRRVYILYKMVWNKQVTISPSTSVEVVADVLEKLIAKLVILSTPLKLC